VPKIENKLDLATHAVAMHVDHCEMRNECLAFVLGCWEFLLCSLKSVCWSSAVDSLKSEDFAPDMVIHRPVHQENATSSMRLSRPGSGLAFTNRKIPVRSFILNFALTALILARSGTKCPPAQ